VIIYDSTCSQEGLERKTCSLCGNYEENNILMKEHVESEWIIDVEPSRKKEGLKHIECEHCGEHLKDEIIPKSKGCSKRSSVVLISFNSLAILLYICLKRKK
jgi:hypothetical protein